MIQFRIPFVLSLLLAFCALCAAPVLAAGEVKVMAHDVEAVFDIGAHTVTVIDRLTVPAGLDDLELGSGFAIQALRSPDGADVDPATAVEVVTEDGEDWQRIDLAALGVAGTGGEIVLEYGGTFHQSAGEMTFSREKVGGEITATISEEGIYLSSMSGWLAWNEDAMAVHDLHLDTPAGYETVTQGERLEHVTEGDRLLTRWNAVHPADGLTLVAARFVVHEQTPREGVTSYTFFLEDDERLRNLYLERTAAYLEMYEDMIGPYPYKKFATVENWFPTGYGMPSYTLLGAQVIRLPFIPYTSFGHEIAHNWWGNSVFVDISEGNWCEGITVYCADYHYKQLESDHEATQYRRRLLKDYSAYVKDPDLDFPLSEFLSRHSGATRAVGYGKSMMVFHMIDRMIGRENFEAGLRKVAAEHQFRKASWSDFFAAFAEISGLDLDAFQQQWLTQPGAPTLRLSDVDFAADRVSFRIEQAEPAYQLDVPVVVTDAAGEREEIVQLDGTAASFELSADGPVRVAVDPDCHLFRRLDLEEIEPTLSQVLADELPFLVAKQPAEPMREAITAFGEEFSQSGSAQFLGQGRLPVDLPPDSWHSCLVFNPTGDLARGYAPPGLVVAGTTVILEGKRYSLKDYDLVFAARNPFYRTMTDLIVYCDSADRLSGLARRLGHYGKYSWLLLPKGQGPVLKGNWPTEESPLIVAK